MDCATCKEHLLAYHYDELDPSTREAVEQALSVCPSCQEELEQMRAVSAAYARLPVPEPSARLRQNVLREARLAVASQPRRTWWRLAMPFAVPAALVIGGAWLAVEIATGGDSPTAPNAVAVSAVEPEAVEGTREEQEARALVRDTAAPEAPAVGSAGEPEAAATAPAPEPPEAAPTRASTEGELDDAAPLARTRSTRTQAAAPVEREAADLPAAFGGAGTTAGSLSDDAPALGGIGRAGGASGRTSTGADAPPPAPPMAPRASAAAEPAVAGVAQEEAELAPSADGDGDDEGFALPVEDLEESQQRATIDEARAEARLPEQRAPSRRDRRSAEVAANEAPRAERGADTALERGLAALDAGEWSEAERWLAEASAAPGATAADRGAALYHRGVVAFRRGELGRARQLLREYVTRFGDGPYRSDAQALLERLDRSPDEPAAAPATDDTPPR